MMEQKKNDGTFQVRANYEEIEDLWFDMHYANF